MARQTFSWKIDWLISIVRRITAGSQWPVGSIYFSINSTNPGTSLGFGTWVAFGAGKVPVGLDSGDVDFNTDEKIGGNKEITITTATMPSHQHAIELSNEAGAFSSGNGYVSNSNLGMQRRGTESSPASINDGARSTGGDGAHDNVQPYIVVRMWKRTV